MNFNKKTEIPTCLGLFVSIILYFVLATFAYQRGMMLYHRYDPTINLHKVYDAFSPKDEINLGDTGFRIAFGVFDTDYRHTLYAKDRIEWDVSIETRKDLVKYNNTKLDIHICTDEDYAEFFDVK